MSYLGEVQKRLQEQAASGQGVMSVITGGKAAGAAGGNPAARSDSLYLEYRRIRDGEYLLQRGGKEHAPFVAQLFFPCSGTGRVGFGG